MHQPGPIWWPNTHFCPDSPRGLWLRSSLHLHFSRTIISLWIYFSMSKFNVTDKFGTLKKTLVLQMIEQAVASAVRHSVGWAFNDLTVAHVGTPAATKCPQPLSTPPITPEWPSQPINQPAHADGKRRYVGNDGSPCPKVSQLNWENFYNFCNA
jgi:hypothetical protein